MALQTLHGGFIYYPRAPGSMTDAMGIASHVINAADEKVAFIMQPTKTGTIRKVSFNTVAHTTSGDVDVRLETVGAADGDPTGTLLDASAAATITISGVGWHTADYGDGNGAAVTQGGDKFAVVIQDNASSTPDIGVGTHSEWGQQNLPYVDLFTGSWSSLASRAPLVSLELSDGSLMPGAKTYTSTETQGNHIFNSGDTPDEIGIIFQLNFKCSVVGAWIQLDLDNDATIILYDSDGSSVLTSKAFDKDIRGSTFGKPWDIIFPASQTLSIDTNYRLTLRPDTTSDVRLPFAVVNANADFDVWPGGKEMHQTQQTGAGGFTETNTQRPYMGIIIDQLDDGAGGGGASGVRNPFVGPIG